MVSAIEWIIEWPLFGAWKQRLWPISLLGVIICIIGECIRKSAMITAATNFNHIVVRHHRKGHVLVTHGIYSLFRHPSYVGWFYWSIGTQIILLNPICVIGYAIVSWKFFDERINDEELCLIKFFGQNYIEYKKNVKTGLPFIKGYNIN